MADALKSERMEKTLIWIYQQLRDAKAIAEFEGDNSHAKYLNTRMERIEWALGYPVTQPIYISLLVDKLRKRA